MSALKAWMASGDHVSSLRREVSGAVDLDEASIEVYKPKEALELFDGSRNRPEFDCFNFLHFHLDTFSTDDVTEELGGALVEQTLLSLEV